MKKTLLLTSIFLLFIVISPAQAAEEIKSFDVTIELNQDSSFLVTEEINYDFGSAQRHGIYREIPFKYTDGARGNFKVRMDEFSVTDENGRPYNFKVSTSGRNKKIKIGDADKFVTGQKTYVISYRVKRAILFGDNEGKDELYWNVTGNDWDVPVDHASAKVILPTDLPKQEIAASCYQGRFSSNEQCQKVNILSGSQVYFDQNSLSIGEGLTVAVGLPKGILQEPSAWEAVRNFLLDNWILGLPLIVFGILFGLWWTRGRDPEGRGTVIAQFNPPDDLTPAQVGTVVDETAHKKDISAEIIHLAVNGYLKINQIEKKGFLGIKSTDYSLEKLKEPDTITLGFQDKIFADLFDGRKTVKLSSLKNKFYRTVNEATKKIYEDVTEQGYFPKNPNSTRTIYIVVGALMFFPAFFLAGFWGAMGVISCVVGAILIIAFGWAMPVKTKKGVLAKEHILGLKKYLEVAEKDRIEFHNAPEKNPKRFEKLLPYAMVLGVEKQWAEQFKDIYQGQEPSWYHGSPGTTFSAIALTNNLTNFRSIANSTLTSKPSSSGGASGGGGFSGGGFGGGGGGSW